MGFLKKPVLMLIANGVGLFVTASFVPGITIPLDFKGFVLVVAALTAINLLLKPIVKLLFMPVLILTLGLGSIIVNALMLYILDFLLTAVTIEGLVALTIATLILSISNFVIHIFGKTL